MGTVQQFDSKIKFQKYVQIYGYKLHSIVTVNFVSSKKFCSSYSRYFYLYFLNNELKTLNNLFYTANQTQNIKNAAVICI